MFGYGVDKKAIYVVLIILTVISFASMSKEGIIALLLSLPSVIIAITFHEFAHAYAADKLGDTTPRNQGRLTLNPLSHLDPFGFILLMFAHIGWGRPVQINPNNFNSNKSRGFCEAMVSLAGPLMNFVIAIVCTVIYKLLYELAFPFVVTNLGYLVMQLLSLTMTINVGLGVFNLIPLPPLDGEKIFKNILPYRMQQWLDRNYQTLYIIFMILWIFGYLEIIVAPVISVCTNAIVFIVENVIGIFI